MRYKHILWDWNGTLLDDVQVCIEVENTLLREYGLPELRSVADYQKVFCFPVIDYYKKLGFDFTKCGFAEVADEYVRRYDAACKKCTLQKGALEVLGSLRDQGVRQYILSASGRESLKKQMEPFHINGYFDAVMGIEDNFARSKTALAQKFIGSGPLNPGEILMVGDTAHDFEVAEEIGCDCVLIPKGHHGRTALEATDARVIGDISEIPEWVEKGLERD